MAQLVMPGQLCGSQRTHGQRRGSDQLFGRRAAHTLRPTIDAQDLLGRAIELQQTFAHLTAGCAVEATGIIVPSPAKGQPFEMQASAIEVTGWVDDPDSYPIQPKPHSMEYLREVAHLRSRTNVIGAVTRVRHTIAQAIHRYFTNDGFVWVNTPIITASAPV